jgi:cobalt-zinc-cadmium resistance protein CzcA
VTSIVKFALRQRVLVVVLLGILIAAGPAAFFNLDIEAYPDPVPPLVDIVTQSNGQSANSLGAQIEKP